MHDIELISKLWQRYSYRSGITILSERRKILEDYQNETGRSIDASTVTRVMQKLDKEKLYNEKHILTFNERTDRIINEPSTLLDSTSILEAIGVDPNGDLEFNKAIVNRWWMDKESILDRIRNGQIKVDLVKRKFELTKEIAREVVEDVFKDKPEIHIKPVAQDPDGLCLIPYKDMHFGINTYKDYIGHQAETWKHITSQYWELVTFIIGSDLFNTNDSKGRTYNDTQVDTMITGIKERMTWAKQFYVPLIDAALEHSTAVQVIYEPGNHDKDTSLQFVTALEWLYPQVDFVIEEKKLYQQIKYKNVWIGTHHGDKKSNPKKVAETFDRYFKKDIANSVYAEVLIGHLHHRFSDEHMNLFIQGLSTGSKDSEYDEEMGFGGGYKAFMIRTYDEHGLKGIQMIDGKKYKQ